MANESIAGTAGAQPAATPAPEPRPVSAGRGASWWSEGWRLFTPAVGTWLLIALFFVGALIVLAIVGMIPILGQLIGLCVQVISPVLVGGLMLGCRAIDRGNPLLFSHLFAGFNQRTGPLITVGLIYTGLSILISLVIVAIMMVIFGATMFRMLIGTPDPSQLALSASDLVLAVLLGILFFLLLLLPLVMAVWFAPALVMLGGLSAGAAMMASFSGGLRNILPFLLYGVIGLGLMIVASIPLGLGWFILGPLLFATVYSSYCDIFEDKDPA
jgi:uncharacterized membrane protein